ncbi:MAG: enoyl-CoA hydratase/isomerase family protein [Deltaproteobacteria bacterium]|nr:enoyl-CoA hydratase/isomerase family protein [Deltaproteobacteria bacterium]
MVTGNDPILYSEDKGIAIIELNRPEKKNAISYECWQLFDKYFTKVADAKNIRALIITGRYEDVFSAGADVSPTDKIIADMERAFTNRDKEALVKSYIYMQGIFTKLAHLPFPTIAAINGLCYGGGVEMSVACDLRVAKEGARICMSETRLGLIPDLGGTVRLARLVGPGRAKDLIYTTREITPEEGMALGLINRVFPAKGFRGHVLEYVRSIIANAPSALKTVKTIIDSSLGTDETSALSIEREEAALNVLSGEVVEGITALMEKRPPRWE